MSTSAGQTAGSYEPLPGQWLLPEEFEQVIRLTPLVSIDLLVRSPDKRVLLGRRKYEPAKGMFFLPGGRITKNESRAAAFKRLTREELGRELALETARFLGVYDHFYPANRFEKPGFGTHYVVLGYELITHLDLALLPPAQHEAYVWRTEAELLASPEVHYHTKAYFND